MLQDLLLQIKKHSNDQRAVVSQSFFKTKKGEYGEGDVFLGLTVPMQKMFAKQYKDLPLKDIETLLHSKIHEYRLIALFLLIHQYRNADNLKQGKLINLYLRNLKYVNNWDLVDSSAPYLLGSYLLNKKRDVLYKLAESQNIWQRRVSIMSAYAFIKAMQFEDALAIAEILLHDKHDLIHKAVGWMLREIGKRDLQAELVFLNKHYNSMPRTMLRYAIEKFDSSIKSLYLAKKPD